MLKLRDVLSRWEADALSQLEAAELLGMSERTFRRWTRRYEEEGEAGSGGPPAGPAVWPRGAGGGGVGGGAAVSASAMRASRSKHFHEHLRRSHGFAWGYTLDQELSAKPWSGGQGACGAARTGASGRADRWSG